MKRIVGILLALGMVACVREPEVADLVKNMVVQTEYDVTEVDGAVNVFTEYNTFALRLDTIGYLSPFTNDTLMLDASNNQTQLPRQTFVKDLVDQLDSNIQARGYTHVEDSDNPDFGVKVVILEQFSFIQTVSYPGYYSGYYGYYGGYYGPIVNTYSSNFVTMVIEVVDIKNFVVNGGKYKVIWSAYIGDLLTSVDRDTKIIEALNQAFVQSPYFSKD
jgi:Domain of unknown function (DUF4136)